jgi:hypothetical protein
MCNPLVPSRVRRLRSMFRLMLANVSRVRRLVLMSNDQRLPEAMTHQHPPFSLAAKPLLPPVVQAKRAFPHERSLCVRTAVMMSPLQLYPPNLVSKRSSPCHLIRSYLPHWSVSISAESSPGVTDFFDNLVDSYSQPSPPPKVPPINDRIANWARNNSGGRSPSAFGGSRSGTLKRRVTRRTVATSAYDDDEEGYGSGEWDEMYELTKIRVKIHFDGDVRGMALDPAMPFAEFRQRVAVKFETSPQSITLKFRDEDGGKVSLHDESDYELAIETARESAKGRPEGKLEIWCERK